MFKAKVFDDTASSYSSSSNKGVIKKFITGILIFFVLIITIVLFIKDPIIESFLEKTLSKQLETEVTIDDFSLQILRQRVSIQGISILSKENLNSYLVKTGYVTIKVNVIEYVFGKFVSVPEIVISNIELLTGESTPKKSNSSSLDEIQEQFSSIDINKLIDDYYGSLRTPKLITQIKSQNTTIIRSAKKELAQSNTALKSLQKNIQNTANEIQNIKTLEELQATITEVEQLKTSILKESNQISSLNQQISSRYAKAESLSKRLKANIQSDTRAVLKDVVNPEKFALTITKQVLQQALQGPVTKYHSILSQLLEMLDSSTTSSETQATLNLIQNKQPSPLLLLTTPLFAQETENSPYQAYMSGFRVGSLKISFGSSRQEYLSLLFENITDQIFNDGEFLSFLIKGTPDTAIEIQGEGTLTLYKQAEKTLDMSIEYKNIPVDINQGMTIVGIKNVSGSLSGRVSTTYYNHKNADASWGMVLQEVKLQPIEGNTSGAILVENLDAFTPIVLNNEIKIEEGKISEFTINGTLLQQLPNLLLDLASSQVADFRVQAEAEIINSLTAQLSPVLQDTLNDISNTRSDVQETLSGTQKLIIDNDKLLVDLQKQIIQVQKESIKEQIREQVPNIKQEVENNVDKIKESLPSF